MTEEQVLALRTDRAFSRRVVSAYLRETAAYPRQQGFEPTFAHLRLSYLVGPNAAVKVMAAAPETALSEVLAPGAVKANPFMANMKASDLIARAARDISREDDGSDLAAAPARAHRRQRRQQPARPRPARTANRCRARSSATHNLPSCRRWSRCARKSRAWRIAVPRQDQAQQRRKLSQTTS